MWLYHGHMVSLEWQSLHALKKSSRVSGAFHAGSPVMGGWCGFAEGYELDGGKAECGTADDGCWFHCKRTPFLFFDFDELAYQGNVLAAGCPSKLTVVMVSGQRERTAWSLLPVAISASASSSGSE